MRHNKYEPECYHDNGKYKSTFLSVIREAQDARSRITDGRTGTRLRGMSACSTHESGDHEDETLGRADADPCARVGKRRAAANSSARANALVSELQVYRELMTEDQATRFLSAVSKLGKRKCAEWRPAHCQQAPSTDCTLTCPDGQAGGSEESLSGECSSTEGCEGCVCDVEEAQDRYGESGERRYGARPPL